MPIQLRSSSYQARPCRALVGWAWWLLCHPSPKVRSATHQLLVESSRVLKRREPQRCVAEFTSHVACSPTVVRKKIPHSTYGTPPYARRPRPTTTLVSQCQLESQTWNLSLLRSGAYFARTEAS